ncbi:MAG: sodium:glutamate symporter [Acidaminococcus sp.]|jgi:Na+/glutamate symporter|nr:sodium:glutamate symporter [Acidaminococcus sp.]MCI2100810.1 sodium:glutamate symporter [Acidaminococcus sp.]MCI2117220.1 sodium:glutamate symporter [Acidaminococcus sp.]
MTIRALMNSMLLLSFFMLVGFFLREKIKIFQKLFLPSSLIGGVLMLILGKQVLGVLEVPAAFKSMPGVLIDVVMASLVFGVTFNKERLKGYLDYVCVPMPAYGLQMGLGTVIGAVLTNFWPDLPKGWGVMGVFSFHGGHGTAAAAGASFAKYGIEGNMAMGMVLSTLGLIIAMVVGMALVNFGVRRGWATYVKEPKAQPAYFYGGPLPESERKPTGHLVTTSISINHLALQCSWLLFSVLIGKYIFTGLGMMWAGFKVLPSVLHGVIGGAVLWKLIEVFHLEKYVDMKTIKMLSGFFLELVVFTAMATLNLKFVSTFAVPIIIYTIILVTLTLPLVVFCAHRFCAEEWFEKACMAFGAATGNTSTGLALVRAVDPDSKSSAGDSHGVYSTLMSWKDAFVGLTPLWLMSGITLTAGVGFGIMIAFLAIGFMFFNTHRSFSGKVK